MIRYAAIAIVLGLSAHTLSAQELLLYEIQTPVVVRAYSPVPVVAVPVVPARPVIAYAPVTTYRPVVTVQPATVLRPVLAPVPRRVVVAPAPVVVRRPVIVTHKVYVPGRPVRNLIKVVAP